MESSVQIPLAIPVGSTARRPTWTELPEQVRRELEKALGGAVAESYSQTAGFTPGFASRLLLADGRRYFVKAADRSIEWLAAAYEREAEVLSLLPAAVAAPRVRQRLDVGEGNGWLVLVFDDVDGQAPTRPWQQDEARRTLTAADELARQLTPAPAGAPWGQLVADILGGPDFSGIEQPLAERRAELDALLASAPAALQGTSLVHNDLRDDNIILASDRVWFCDWNWPTLGPDWVDAVCLLTGMVGDGLEPESLIAGCPVLQAADPDAVDAFLALLLAYFLDSAARPAVATSPSIRPHQRWYADVITNWLARRRRWDEH